MTFTFFSESKRHYLVYALFFCLYFQISCVDRSESVVSEDINDEALLAADRDAENWLTYGRTYSEQRHSPLTQVNLENIDDLGLAWSYEFGDKRGLEATPIVVNGILYTTSSWSILHAFNAATGEKIWTYNPKVPRGHARYACCDVVNRGPAFYKGKVYAGTLDGRLIAVDARTGELAWEIQTTPKNQAYTITGAPRVVGGKILIGNGGAEYGVRGYVSAYDAQTGAQIWRTYTVPGNPDQPFESKAMEEAAKTWSGEWWRLGGGGTCWDAIVYDPELDLVYVGTGNGSPWYRRLRSPDGGDNLFLSSIIALRASDGELVWHYQTTPGDNWDYTATQPLMLADLDIDGVNRKVIMQAPKNGFFYVIDRVTGEFISARAFGHVTWAEGMDDNGRPIESKVARELADPTFVRPAPNGAHNWHPMAFHPKTGLVYFPVYDGAFLHIVDSSETVNPRDWNTGRALNYRGPMLEEWDDLPMSGKLVAWDPVAQEEVWHVDQNLPVSGGVLSSGDLLFQGRADGNLRAYRASDGKLLWEFDAQTGIAAPPVTYMVDGVQYIAVMAGWGGPEVLWNTGFGRGKVGNGRLLVFALGRNSTLPEPETASLARVVPDIDLQATAAEVHDGSVLYYRHCGRCHGANAISSGLTPDLRYSSTEVHMAIESIVLGGAREVLGMPSFSNDLDQEQVRLIQAYILEQSRKGLVSEESSAN